MKKIKKLNKEKNLAQFAFFIEIFSIFNKQIWKWKSFFGNVLLTFIIIFGTLALIPYSFSFSFSINFLIYLTSSFVYGYVFYNFRRSTIFENSLLSGMKKSTLYLAIFATMFIYSFAIFSLILLIYIFLILTNSSLLMNAWFFSPLVNVEYEMSLSQVGWSLIFYWFLVGMFLNFSLFYLFQNISNSQRGFYLFIFFYMFMLFFYGAAINLKTWHLVPLIPYSESNLFFLTNVEYNYFSFIDGNTVLSIKNNISDQWSQGKYFTVFMEILTPHYWINNFFGSIMLGSYLDNNIFDNILSYDHRKQLLLFTNYYPSIDLSFVNIKFSWYGSQSNYWSFKNDISWLLSLYLWIIYFIVYSWIGHFIDSIKFELI
ncbi:MAG: hypothetical protein GQ557_01080 [Mycoplasmataceae bacterium]|nr:hypothetical protein [Mycoplasmataceae bacterium]